MNTLFDKFNLSENTAVITGGGTGLGREMALALSRAGAYVIIAGRRQNPLKEVADIIIHEGGKCLPVQTDITDSSEVYRLFDLSIKKFGKVDVLVNNAGMVAGQGGKPIWEISDSEWRKVIDANLTGSFYCARAISQHMIERESGKIINVSSGFGLRGGRDNYMYASSKGGVIQLTRALATSLGRYGVTSNCLVPGIFRTEGTIKSQEQLPRAEFVPVGRLGIPNEIGPIVVFLASQASNYMNGSLFSVDGGALAGGYAPTDHKPFKELSENILRT